MSFAGAVPRAVGPGWYGFAPLARHAGNLGQRLADTETIILLHAMLAKSLSSQVRKLPLQERAELLRTLYTSFGAQWPGIEKTPGVQGGAACVVRTRIPIWLLEGWRRDGMPEDQILANYPSLTKSDLANAWTYVSTHKREIDKALRANETA